MALIWILFTDQLVEFLVDDPAKITMFQTHKGWVYVILTTLGLYYLIKKHDALRSEISEQQEKDEELRTKLLDKIPVMITMYDPDLDKVIVNKAFTDYTGYTSEMANGMDLMKACYPDKDYRNEVQKFMSQPESGWMEVLMTTKSGKKIYTSWSNLSLTNDTQVGVGINLTEIRESEHKVRQSEELLSNLFESLDESVILLEPNTRKIIKCNDATERILGYSKEELIGESTAKLHVDKEAFKKFHEIGIEELEKTGSFKTEYKLKKKNGDVIHTDHTVTFVNDDEGEAHRVVSVIRDITQKKVNSELMIKATLEGENRERKRMAQEIHDGIGQYISAINLNLSSLKKGIEDLPETHKKRFKTSLELTKKAMRESRRMAHNLMPSELDHYGLKEATETLLTQIEQTGKVQTQLEWDLNNDLLKEHTKIHLYRIIQEAVNNSIKHGHSSNISIALRNDENRIYCVIRDDGEGRDLDSDKVNIGIGIKSMKTRSELLGGKFKIESNKGEGFAIRISIPA